MSKPSKEPSAAILNNIRQVITGGKPQDNSLLVDIERYGDVRAEEGCRTARIDELKRVASQNNSEYTSDYIEGRIEQLEKENL